MWSEENIELIELLNKRTVALSHIYSMAASHFNDLATTWSFIVTIGMFVFGTGGLCATISQFINDSNPDTAFMLIVGLVLSVGSLVVGVLEVISSRLDYAGKSNKCAATSDNYSEMYLYSNTIINREAKPDFIDFFSELYRRDASIKLEAVGLPDGVIDSYNEIYGTHALSTHILFSEISELEEFNNSPTLERDPKIRCALVHCQLNRIGKTNTITM